ncbi:alpha/beta-hydrolase [Coprinellus micaceus]|uniref:Alpha/beta-hydrolase n=1 Tax=Coprinellus micaceus TaxID=71717 RepID=A0A4Y7SPE2_COPMI|nr:alpha/beta-hydrolase [Coprinellus micaceus]
MPLCVESAVLPPDSTYSLYVTAKRYWSDTRPKPHSTPKCTGLTLVLFHATSFHKEMWEPCLEALFALVDKSKGVLIEEAWSIESPNHGESAVLNVETLRQSPFSEQFGVLGYATAAHRFIYSRAEFSHSQRRRLVAIGHSAGGNVSVLVQALAPLIQFRSVIVIEPMAFPGGDQFLEELRGRLLHTVRKRRDRWSSREEARMSLPWHGRFPERRCWHPRIVDLYLALIPARGSDGDRYFTLACTKAQEANMYLDEKGSPIVLEVLDQVSSRIPLHLVLGEVKNFISAEIHATLASPSPNGRKWASVTTVPGVGHLIPQEQPDSLANVLFQLMNQMSATTALYQHKL